ncbi:MAG: indole-3-glycerol phosphate synthase TrpC [Oscillospiraceae bacterium]|jgi:indole-3-glycerol phosphate synthase|nr:indole-3-glycerol phosphate synthase TrpC [Oscillospiraceae bacterium]
MILNDIVAERKIQLEKETERKPFEKLLEEVEAIETNCKNFYKALSGSKLAVIAEVKKASPSKGIIREDFKPIDLAKEYIKAGANALSILTEEHYFQGSTRYLRKIRRETYLPILRKDFIIDEYQVYESRLYGADAILLIASILDDEQLERFDDIATDLGMSVVFEVHNKEELERVLKFNPLIVGINNRDLKDFSVNLKMTEELAGEIPPECLIISESGIKSNEDMKFVRNYGANAVLIGEALMRSGNIPLTMQELRSGV